MTSNQVNKAAIALLGLMNRQDAHFLMNKLDVTMAEIQSNQPKRSISAWYYNRERTAERIRMRQMMVRIAAMRPAGELLAWSTILRLYFRESTLTQLDDDTVFQHGFPAIAAVITDMVAKKLPVMTNAYQCSIQWEESLTLVGKCFKDLVPFYEKFLARGEKPSIQEIYNEVHKLSGFGDMLSLLVAGDSYYYGLVTDDAALPVKGKEGTPVLGLGAVKGLELLKLTVTDLPRLQDVIQEMLRDMEFHDAGLPICSGMCAAHFNAFILEHALCKLHRYNKKQAGDADLVMQDGEE